jgi:hypothetical protein
MPRGNTATINVATFRADWQAGLPIAVLCTNYTISRDQVVRLRDIWELPLRHDRKARTFSKSKDPTPSQIRERCLEVQSLWDEATRQKRHWKEPTPWQIIEIELPQNLSLDDLQG